MAFATQTWRSISLRGVCERGRGRVSSACRATRDARGAALPQKHQAWQGKDGTEEVGVAIPGPGLAGPSLSLAAHL